MKKIIISALFLFSSFFLFNFVSPVLAAPGDELFGQIEAPQGVAQFNEQAGEGANNIGLLIFISNLIKFASVVAGIWVLFNFITAGFTYVTASGDKGAYDKIGSKLTLSVTGLVLIVGAYTIAGILGLIIFGDPTYIINPDIPTISGP